MVRNRAQPHAATLWVDADDFDVDHIAFLRPRSNRIPVRVKRSHRDRNANPQPQPIVEIARTNVFVGQPIAVRVILPGPIPPLQGIQLTGSGFLVD